MDRQLDSSGLKQKEMICKSLKKTQRKDNSGYQEKQRWIFIHKLLYLVLNYDTQYLWIKILLSYWFHKCKTL